MKLIVDARVLSSRPCGVGMYAYRYIRELMKYPNIELTLLTDVVVSNEIKELEAAGVPVVKYGKPIFRSIGVLGYFNFVKKELRKRQPDLFWEPNCLVPIRLKGYEGALAVTLYDMFPLTMPECFSRLYREYFRRGVESTVMQADLICYDSMEAKHDTELYFPAAKVGPSFVCYPVVDRTAISGADPVKAGADEKETKEKYFYYVGNVELRKGVDILLDAYRLYREEGGQKNLIVAGGLKDDCLKDKLEKMREVEGFSYVGYVSEEDKKKLFAECDTFVFPSRGEGFGIPLLESMAAGKPVIASNLSIFQEIIGDCVRYFDVDAGPETRVRALCDAMLEDQVPDLRRYEAVLRCYDPEQRGRIFVERLLKLCGEN